jgi:hypothetical protein
LTSRADDEYRSTSADRASFDDLMGKDIAHLAHAVPESIKNAGIMEEPDPMLVRLQNAEANLRTALIIGEYLYWSSFLCVNDCLWS